MTDEEMKECIRGIRRQLTRSMNGIVSHKMGASGIRYEKNYGVELGRLMQQATLLPRDARLAQALWEIRIRETMLLALFLYPVEEFGVEQLGEWVSEIPTYEVAEIASKGLFAKSGADFGVLWNMTKGSGFAPCCALLVAASRMNTLTDDEALQMRGFALEAMVDADMLRAITVFFRRFVQCKANLCDGLLEALEERVRQCAGAEVLYEEVKTQLLY